MLENRGNLWDLAKGHILCITTNGFVKRNGDCVMGRGIAAEAVKRFPKVSQVLGHLITTHGNKVLPLGVYGDYLLMSFPVKPSFGKCGETGVVRHMKSKFSPGDTVPGWACLADPAIIQRSIDQLKRMCDPLPAGAKVFLPQPGCGAGELSWTEVKPLVQHLSDRYVFCTF